MARSRVSARVSLRGAAGEGGEGARSLGLLPSRPLRWVELGRSATAKVLVRVSRTSSVPGMVGRMFTSERARWTGVLARGAGGSMAGERALFTRRHCTASRSAVEHWSRRRRSASEACCRKSSLFWWMQRRPIVMKADWKSAAALSCVRRSPVRFTKESSDFAVGTKVVAVVQLSRSSPLDAFVMSWSFGTSSSILSANARASAGTWPWKGFEKRAPPIRVLQRVMPLPLPLPLPLPRPLLWLAGMKEPRPAELVAATLAREKAASMSDTLDSSMASVELWMVSLGEVAFRASQAASNSAITSAVLAGGAAAACGSSASSAGSSAGSSITRQLLVWPRATRRKSARWRSCVARRVSSERRS
mmetsp:Transcript_15449/g.60395  ORF Transcript_15449/g.60395 Transcript_15449/m.60395 type:complete len:361 (+) Transcript_15449:1066-2148(+)